MAKARNAFGFLQVLAANLCARETSEIDLLKVPDVSFSPLMHVNPGYISERLYPIAEIINGLIHFRNMCLFVHWRADVRFILLFIRQVDLRWG